MELPGKTQRATSPASLPVSQLPSSKEISELDHLLQAMLKVMPHSKPWQRQLRFQLTDVDRLVQVLRLTISLGREEAEVRSVVEQVHLSLKAANAFVLPSRADTLTKTAMQLCVDFSKKMGYRQ